MDRFPFSNPPDVDVDVTQLLLLLVLPSINAERRQHVRDLFHISAKEEFISLLCASRKLTSRNSLIFRHFDSIWTVSMATGTRRAAH